VWKCHNETHYFVLLKKSKKKKEEEEEEEEAYLVSRTNGNTYPKVNLNQGPYLHFHHKYP
jgi:hypothetical protein